MIKTKLTDMKITHVSYVRKGANKKQFFLMKSDEDTNFEKEIQVFVNKADKEKKLVYGVVYEPDTLDTQGEFASDAEIEKAAHEFLADSRNIDLQHNFKSEYGTVVESYIAPVDFKIGDINIKKGSWALVTKANDDVWESIKKGQVTGYSMAGKATKTEVEEFQKQTLETSDDEYKGFFNVIQEFFSKGKKDIEKPIKEDKTKGEEDMKIEEITEAIKRAVVEAIRPINDKLEALERQDRTNDSADNEISEALKKAVAEAIEPINQRIVSIEKAKGVSRQEQEEKLVKKSASVFTGLDI